MLNRRMPTAFARLRIAQLESRNGLPQDLLALAEEGEHDLDIAAAPGRVAAFPRTGPRRRRDYVATTGHDRLPMQWYSRPKAAIVSGS
jgi:predicted membrane-bound mannosyltransferase